MKARLSLDRSNTIEDIRSGIENNLLNNSNLNYNSISVKSICVQLEESKDYCIFTIRGIDSEYSTDEIETKVSLSLINSLEYNVLTTVVKTIHVSYTQI